MSKLTQQHNRLHLYRELNEIVSAMKNMAEVELHRATRMEEHQRQALATAREGLAMLLQAAPHLTRHTDPARTILLVLGSERGFCGGFNEQLARSLAPDPTSYGKVLVMGGRLAAKLEVEHRYICFSGPSTVDEILPRLQSLLEYLRNLPGTSALEVLSHTKDGLKRQQLHPWPALPAMNPVVHVDTLCKPAALLETIQWQCLFQGLFRVMLVSLLQENRLRLQQMEGAREHIEALTTALLRRLNLLRQQEIVEEIEMILVSQTADDHQS